MKISFYDANNNYHEHQIYAVFHNGENKYIAYIKPTENNLLNILVCKYETKDKNIIRIYDVTSKKEWDFINCFLKNKIKGDLLNHAK